MFKRTLFQVVLRHVLVQATRCAMLALSTAAKMV
jgi:hypothetical protein